MENDLKMEVQVEYHEIDWKARAELLAKQLAIAVKALESLAESKTSYEGWKADEALAAIEAVGKGEP